MRKKTVALGSLVSLLCATQVVAGGCFYKSGFLAGGHVGASFGKGTLSGSLVLPPALPAVGSSQLSGKSTKTGAVLGLLGGYRHIFNDGFTLGANVEINLYGSNELSKTLNHPPAPVDPFVNRIKRTYGIIPAVTLGKVFCGRYHVGLGLGLGITKFKQGFTNVNDNITRSASQTRLGFVPSLGLEYAANQNVSLTGNVSYELYSKVKKTFQDAVPLGGPNPTYTTSVSPKYLTIKVGAVYRF